MNKKEKIKELETKLNNIKSELEELKKKNKSKPDHNGLVQPFHIELDGNKQLNIIMQKCLFVLGYDWFSKAKKIFNCYETGGFVIGWDNDINCITYNLFEDEEDNGIKVTPEEIFILAMNKLKLNSEKPDWKDAPKWANWLAQDENGAWYFYEERPELDVYANCFNVDGKRECFYVDEWEETLEQRPKE